MNWFPHLLLALHYWLVPGLIFLTLLRLPVANGYFGLTSNTQLTSIHGSDQCPHYLTKRQRKMCGRDSGMPAALADALELSISQCQERFQNERWNCSIHNTSQRANLLKRGVEVRAPGSLDAVEVRAPGSLDASYRRR
ncbi:protein Wnt-9b-like [Patiria miniata]|uniref:Protein Wnt n=1 Tax=Patiria miniata TaxID=46514 RepID=A0A913Z6Z4_PATMI|nr:protein Wnt-9b-like [Patiria miniata]